MPSEVTGMGRFRKIINSTYMMSIQFDKFNNRPVTTTRRAYRNHRKIKDMQIFLQILRQKVLCRFSKFARMTEITIVLRPYTYIPG